MQANEKYPGKRQRMTSNELLLFAAGVGLYNLVTGTISICSDVRYNRAFQFGGGRLQPDGGFHV